jgi:uncharacterized repeat protein (TIGR01451 family)
MMTKINVLAKICITFALTALLAMLVALGLPAALAGATSTIAFQGFEGTAGDDWNYTNNPATYNTSGDVWIVASAVETLNPNTGSNLWAMRDLNNPNGGGAFAHTLEFSDVNVSGYAEVEISFAYNVFEYDSGDRLDYQVFFDGAGQGEVALFTGSGNASTAGWETEVITVPDSVMQVSLVLSATQDGGGDYAAWDDIMITGLEQPHINEVLLDPPGTDAPNEYVELRGEAGSVITDGIYLLGIEGDSSGAGDVQNIFDLSGLSFGSNGYLVLLQNGNSYSTDPNANVLTSNNTGFSGFSFFSADSGTTGIENQSSTFLLVQASETTTPLLTTDIDSNDDGTPDGATYSGWTILDSVSVLDDDDATEYGYADIIFAENVSGGSVISRPTGSILVDTGADKAEYVARIGSSFGSTADDWLASGLAGATPNWTLGAGETFPAEYAELPLDHIGSDNPELQPAALALTKSVTPTTNVAVNDTVTYTLVLSNSGNISDTNVLLTDTLPLDVTFVDWIEQPANAFEASGVITWSGTVTGQDAITISFIVTSSATGGTVVNTAEFSGTLQSGQSNEAAFGAVILPKSLPLTEGFDSCSPAPADWLIYSVDADSGNTWFCSSSSARANAFGDSATADDWLITPPIDFDVEVYEALTFRSYTNFTDNGLAYPQLSVKYSTNYSGSGDPSIANWTELTGITFSPEDSSQWTDSGEVDLSAISGVAYIAFQYESSGTSSSDTTDWRVDGFNVFNNPPEPELSVTKDATPEANVVVNDLVTYMLVLSNSGLVSDTNVLLTDTLPAEVDFAYWVEEPANTTVSNDEITWSGTVTAGESITFTFAATNTASTGAVVNTVEFSGSLQAGSQDATYVASSVPITPIYTIQGDMTPGVITESTYAGQVVTTTGIVVGDFQSSSELGGFFLQDFPGDGDTATSDGIFVAVTAAEDDVAVGDELIVSGQVTEDYEHTTLDSIDRVSLISSGNAVNPTLVTLPEQINGDLEAYEGMLVEIDSEMTVAQNYFVGRYGQMTLSSDGRLYQPTNQFTPGSVQARMLASDNARNLLILDDGQDVSSCGDNPNPVPYLGSPPPNVIRAGDVVTGLIGVLDFGKINSGGPCSTESTFARDYRLQPTVAPTFTVVNAREDTPPAVGGRLKVVSFNVLNYFNGDGQGGGFPTSRGADSLTEFNRQRTKIITAMVAIDADVFGLMEIENDGYGANSAIQDLVNGLNDVLGDGTYAFVDPGISQIGTDEIAVGLIYKPATVDPTGNSAILDDSFDANYRDDYNRPALAQTFMEKSSGEKFTVIVNHFKSKGSPCDAIGDPEDPNGQGNCNLTRLSAANVMTAWLKTDPTTSQDPDFLVIGDLNAYAKEDPIDAFERAGYTNLLNKFGGDTAYSYIFDGLSGYLDHALANSSMEAQVTGVADWHINADEPPVIDYDENFNPAGYYSPDAFRASDHDPVIIGLDLSTSPLVSLPNGVAAGDVTQTSAVLWARDGAGPISFTYSTMPDLSGGTVVNATVTDPLLPVKQSITGLSPNTTYYYQVESAQGETASGKFNTPAAVGTTTGLRFGVTGDWRGELSPYPAIRNVTSRNLDFMVGHGDTIYADYESPVLPGITQTETITQYRLKHAEVYSGRLGLNFWADVRANTAIFATIDDHEVINDFSGGEPAISDTRFIETSGLINDTQLYENGLQAFQEYNPIRDEFYGTVGGDGRMDNERKLYRYQTFGSDAALFVLDNRSFRDAPLPEIVDLTNPTEVGQFLAATFTPGRTMLGSQQLADLKADLLDAQQKGIIWKFVAVPEPIQNLGPLAAQDRFEGYAAERTEILKFINDNDITNVVFVAADVHGTVVNNLTYQEGFGQPQIAVPAFEISTGSVAFDAPFGPTVIDLAFAAGLISSQEKAFYDTLPVANDPDDTVDDKDDFVKSLANSSQLTPLGYDPVGLNNNLAVADGLIDAQLLQGDYMATHTFGWTEFDISPSGMVLTITTYGIDPYTPTQVINSPSTITNAVPSIVSQFVVNAAEKVKAQLVHGSPLAADLGVTDLFAQSSEVSVRITNVVDDISLSGLKFGDTSNFFDLSPFPSTLTITPTAIPGLAQTVTFTPTGDITQTILLIGDNVKDYSPVEVVVLTDTTTATAALRIVHAAPFAGDQAGTGVDVTIEGSSGSPTTIDGVLYKENTGFIALDAGVYTVTVNLSGTMTTVLSRTIQLNDGDLATIFVVGDGTNQTIQSLLVGASDVQGERRIYLPALLKNFEE